WEGDMVPFNGIMVASFWPPILERAQENSAYIITRPLERIRYGMEGMKWKPKGACHDCGALPGQFHVRSCDMETCPACGLQALSCPCATTYMSDEEYRSWVQTYCMDEGENELVPWKRKRPAPKRWVLGSPARPRAAKKKRGARKKARTAR